MNTAAEAKSQILLAIGVDMGMPVIDTGVKADPTVKPAPNYCPKCFSDNVEYDNYDFWGDGTSSQEASCNDCEAGWQEIYHFDRIEITDEGTK